MIRSSHGRGRFAASLVVALALAVAGCNASSAPSAAPTVAVAQLRALDVQARIPVPNAFDILPAFDSLWVVANGSG